MSENMIKIFNNDEFGSLKTIMVNNEPYFCFLDMRYIIFQ